MRLSVERLRWVLVGGAVLLVAVLFGAVKYGRYEARKRWEDLERKHHFTVSHDTNGVTYSQSDGKRTIFTVHAAKAIPQGDGKYLLKTAQMTLYGKTAGENEVISGEDFWYDQKQGLARALGPVTLELHTPPSPQRRAETAGGTSPAGKNRTNPDTAADGSQTIHVTTSGLQYMRSLGLATTGENVHFTWGGLTCDSRGAEFDPDQSTLHLLAAVHLTGTMQGHPLEMTAAEANLDRTLNVADLSHAVVHSDGRTASADHVLAYFRADGSMQRAQATGSVVLSSGTQNVTATRMDATLNEQSRPLTLQLSGGVAMADSNPQRPLHGSAATVDATFDAKGLPKTAIATGAVSAWMTDKTGGGPGLSREMHGDRMVGTFEPAKSKGGVRLSTLDATGNARVKGESVEKTKTGPVVKTMNAAGDELRAIFGVGVAGRAEMQHVSGAGHTMLEQQTPLGEMETSTGDTLEMAFGSTGAKGSGVEAGKVTSAIQTGHVDIHTRAAARTATAGAGPVKTKDATPEETVSGGDRAVYNGVDATMTLSGAARFSNGEDAITASTVVLDQRTGDAVARGKVVAAIGGESSSSAAAAAQPVTHIMAAEARLTRAGKLAEFRGTDAAPARMWQGGSQVQAAVLFFDGVKRSMSARPLAVGAVIHAVFAGQGKAAEPVSRTQGAAAKVMRVSAQRMDYADPAREATFSGQVKMEGEDGTVESDRAVVMLTPARAARGAAQPATVTPLAGSVEKAVAYGNVRLQQPGRRGTGDQLTYTAADDKFVLTGTAGHPPHVVDDQQGDVTGAVLIFVAPARGQDKGDSTIIVAGEPPGSKARGGRVHTETDVRR